ncbi:MAG TPA: 50S ribosomal protein L25 [Pirellulaceae bacterium]|nr:50S ribosomal protein L25 [Pirellulaceae bacterium]
MAEVFNVVKRTELGRASLKKLRRTGKVPAVLYGHGEASLSLSIPKGEIANAFKHSSKVVQLQGEITEEALIREVQWDTYGIEVLHVDLIRVSQGETVDVKLQVVLKGDAAGIKQGGVLNHITHEIEIKCPVSAIPESLVANLTNLQLGSAFHASEVELPAGASLISDPHVIIVSCNPPKGDDDAAAGIAIEPELIRKPKEEKKAD